MKDEPIKGLRKMDEEDMQQRIDAIEALFRKRCQWRQRG